MERKNKIDLCKYLDLNIQSDKYHTYITTRSDLKGNVDFICEVCGFSHKNGDVVQAEEIERLKTATEIKSILEAAYYVAEELRICGGAVSCWCEGCITQQKYKGGKCKPVGIDGKPIKCRYSRNCTCCLNDIVKHANAGLARLGHWLIEDPRTGELEPEKQKAMQFSKQDLEAVEKELAGATHSQMFRDVVGKMIAEYKKGGEA